MIHLPPTTYDFGQYSFTGLPASSFPSESRHIIESFAGKSKHSIESVNTRLALAHLLLTQLHAIDILMVQIHHQSALYLNLLETSTEPYPLEWLKQQYEEDSARSLCFATLSAKRLSTLMDFTLKFDTLVWIETQRAIERGIYTTEDEMKGHRDALITPYLEYAGNSLSQLEKAVFAVMAKRKYNISDDDVRQEMLPFIKTFVTRIKDTHARLGE